MASNRTRGGLVAVVSFIALALVLGAFGASLYSGTTYVLNEDGTMTTTETSMTLWQLCVTVTNSSTEATITGEEMEPETESKCQALPGNHPCGEFKRNVMIMKGLYIVSVFGFVLAFVSGIADRILVTTWMHIPHVLLSLIGSAAAFGGFTAVFISLNENFCGEKELSDKDSYAMTANVAPFLLAIAGAAGIAAAGMAHATRVRKKRVKIKTKKSKKKKDKKKPEKERAAVAINVDGDELPTDEDEDFTDEDDDRPEEEDIARPLLTADNIAAVQAQAGDSSVDGDQAAAEGDPFKSFAAHAIEPGSPITRKKSKAMDSAFGEELQSLDGSAGPSRAGSMRKPPSGSPRAVADDDEADLPPGLTDRDREFRKSLIKPDRGGIHSRSSCYGSPMMSPSRSFARASVVSSPRKSASPAGRSRAGLDAPNAAASTSGSPAASPMGSAQPKLAQPEDDDIL